MDAKTETPTEPAKRGDALSEARVALGKIRRFEADKLAAINKADCRRVEVLANCSPEARAVVNALLALPESADGVLDSQPGDPDHTDAIDD